MAVVTALFDTSVDASEAIRALRGAGIAAEDISIIANAADREVPQTGADGQPFDADAAIGAAESAGVGAILGGAGGMLAGLGALAIPGIGPVVAGGWLLASAVGAVAGAAVGGAAGGLLGALSEAGVPDEQAHVYAEGVRRGGTLLTIRVEDEREGVVEDLLGKARRVNVEHRRAHLQDEGWQGFDETADPYSPDQISGYRDLYSKAPII